MLDNYISILAHELFISLKRNKNIVHKFTVKDRNLIIPKQTQDPRSSQITLDQ